MEENAYSKHSSIFFNKKDSYQPINSLLTSYV